MCECLAIWEESEIYNQKNLCYTCNIMRNYIVFDLEWNQSSGGRDCSSPRLAFEIFEIGAVKLNENFEKVLPYTDLFLYDIKLTDSKKHKRYTGVSNELILDNLKRLFADNAKIWIRIPVISGVNDILEEMKTIKEILF